MSSPTELRVFVSSTFRDLHDEREHLVKKIFPEIRALCRSRGITFTEVDLRWGLTDEDVVLGQVIGTCLAEIDRCRPYFLGITGERYGYVPELLEYYKDPELLRQYPWIEEAALNGASIIDLEFRHAALNDAECEMSGDHRRGTSRETSQNASHDNPRNTSRFFFRRQRRGVESAVDETERERLEALKQRVRDGGFETEEFRDPASLGESVYDALVEIIDRDFANVVAPSALELERSSHRAFAESRRHAYIPNPEYLNRLNGWFVDVASSRVVADHPSPYRSHDATSTLTHNQASARSSGLPAEPATTPRQETPLVIYAESGSGKSSLVSFWCQQMRRRHPGLPIIEHYVGIGAGANDHLAIMRHIIEEIRELFSRNEEIPSEPEKLERQFANWLGFSVGAPLLVVIDGINQLSGRALELAWLPPVMPEGVRLIVTSTVEQTLVALRERGWSTLGMQPLSEKEREAVVVRFLSEYHKALSREQVQRLAADIKCSHPLFLRTVLEELRLEARHETIDRELDRYLLATGTEDLFQLVLERIEEDFGARAVRAVMSLLWCSRAGLNENELQEITGISRLKLSTMLGGLDYHLVRKEGVLTFFHDYLRRAVEKRFLSQEHARVECWKQLASYFDRAPLTLRSTRELLNALEMLGEHERLLEAIADIPRFELLWPDDGRYEVLRLWAGTASEAIGRMSIEAFLHWSALGHSDARTILILESLTALLNRVGCIEEAENIARQRIELARAMSDLARESSALSDLCWILMRKGATVGAEEAAHSAESIARASGDMAGLAFALQNRGQLHLECGDYESALNCMIESESTARTIGDQTVLADALAGRGSVYFERGEYDPALDCFAEAEAIARAQGDRHAVAYAVGNRGAVHGNRGESNEALRCFAEQESIMRALGDWYTLAVTVGNRGYVIMELGELDEALLCFAEQEALARSLEDRRSVAGALNNRVDAYIALGDFAQALACSDELESLARELDDRKLIGMAVGNRGRVHLQLGEYDDAIACIGAALDLHAALGYRHGCAEWYEHVADILLEDAASSLGAFPWPSSGSSVPADLDMHGRAFVRARALTDEARNMAVELGVSNMPFRCSIRDARIAHGEGHSRDACEILTSLLDESNQASDRAECHYWLWKLDLDRAEDHRSTADGMYADLLTRSPRHSFKLRLAELQAEPG